MTNKTNVTNTKKGRKKSQSPKIERTEVVASSSAPSPPKTQEKKIKKQPKKQTSSVVITEQRKPKRSKSCIRSLFKLSILSCLVYAFYMCSSPFDTTGKPCVCAAIDPIKSDLYSIYQSEFYQKNANPYISPVIEKGNEFYLEYGIPAQRTLTKLYLNHGIPAQKKVYSFYNQHVQPHINQGCNHMHVVYKKQLEPYLVKATPYLNPYYDVVKPYIDKVKSIKQQDIEVFCEITNQKLYQLQRTIDDKAAPYVHQAKIIIITWVHQLLEIDYRRLCWKVNDFIQFGLIPYLKDCPAVTEIKLTYHKYVTPYFNAYIQPVIDTQIKPFINTNIKPFIDTNIKPFVEYKIKPFIEYNIKPYVDIVIKSVSAFIHSNADKLINFIKFHLPERHIVQEEKVYAAKTTSTQLKTSIIKPKTKSISITPPAVIAQTVTVSTKESISETPKVIPTTVATSTTVQSTIDKYNSNKNDIVKEKSVKPETTEEYVQVDSPDPEKKEAIYVPTCNSEEEQLIVANTDKNVQTVRTDKHVVAVPTDKDLFEVHKEEMNIPIQPTSANTAEDTGDEMPKEQVVIQAPIQRTEKETPSSEEDSVFIIQTEVPTNPEDDIMPTLSTNSEEAIVSSILAGEENIIEEELVSQVEAESTTKSKDEAVHSTQNKFSTNPEEAIIASIKAGEEDIIEEEIVSQVQTESPALSEEDIIFSTQVDIPTPVNQKVFPFVADEGVIPAANKEEIIPVSKEEEIIPVTKEEEVVPVINADEEVIPVDKEEEIVPIAKKEEKVTPVAKKEEEIIPIAKKEEEVIPVAKKEEINTPIATDKVSSDKTAASNTESETPKIPCEIVSSNEEDPTIACEIIDETKTEEKIFVPPAIQNGDLVLDLNKDSEETKEEEEPVFIKVDEEPIQKEKVHYQDPIVKVEDIKEQIVDKKVPTVKAEDTETTTQ